MFIRFIETGLPTSNERRQRTPSEVTHSHRHKSESLSRLLEIDSLLHDIRTGDVYQTSIPSSLKDLIEETRMELENNGIAVLDIEQIRSFLDPNTEFV